MNFLESSAHYLITKKDSEYSVFDIVGSENLFGKTPIEYFCAKYLFSRFEFQKLFYIESYTFLILAK